MYRKEIKAEIQDELLRRFGVSPNYSIGHYATPSGIVCEISRTDASNIQIRAKVPGEGLPRYFNLKLSESV